MQFVVTEIGRIQIAAIMGKGGGVRMAAILPIFYHAAAFAEREMLDLFAQLAVRRNREHRYPCSAFRHRIVGDKQEFAVRAKSGVRRLLAVAVDLIQHLHCALFIDCQRGNDTGILFIGGISKPPVA